MLHKAASSSYHRVLSYGRQCRKATAITEHHKKERINGRINIPLTARRSKPTKARIPWRTQDQQTDVGEGEVGLEWGENRNSRRQSYLRRNT